MLPTLRSLGLVADSSDNKAFMRYHSNNLPSTIQLRLHGQDVEGHDFGCGNDSIQVYTIIFIEGSDRENPTCDAVSGEGIAPENL